MGAFFVASQDTAAKWQDLDTAHRARGFALARRVSLGDYTLFQYRKLDGEGGLGVETADGGLACLTGQLLYRGRSGEEALRLYCTDLARDAVDESRVIGHFALLLCKDDTLRLTTDAMGFYQVYVNAEAGLASSSFWTMLELSPTVSIDTTGVYQYAWNGATFGGHTFVKEIRRLPADAKILVDGRITIRIRPGGVAAPPAGTGSFLELVDTHSMRLRALFEDLASGFGDRLRVSFSGGYDSRLVLAGLQAAGLRPPLFVYGRDDDIDVAVARQVAAGEGLLLKIVDKSRLAAGVTDLPCRQEADFVCFDAWKVDGIFDDGVDAADRLSRHADGGVPLNGSLGEIYRNFFYIPDRPMPLRSVVDSFFSAYAPSACTERFSAAGYRDALVRAFQTELGDDQLRVPRDRVERLYPLVRGRYWTGRDVNLNLRFGRMIFPFMHAQLIAGTADIPIAFKNHGRLEAKLIERLAPSLAAYPSAYGYRLCDAPPLRHRAKSWLTLFRPPALRRHAYRLRFSRPTPFPPYLSADHLARFMDASLPYMRRFFRPERLHDPDAFNRVATMEYLFQRYNAWE
jgi:asparagine synthase (glutamine-hydrolysing)